MSRYDLTEFEWRVIEPLLPNKPRGVPRVDDRHLLDATFRFALARYAGALRPAQNLLQSLPPLDEGGCLGSDHGCNYRGLRSRRADDRRHERPRSPLCRDFKKVIQIDVLDDQGAVLLRKYML
jgi:transposase